MSCVSLVFTNLCSCYCAYQLGRNYEKSKLSHRNNNSRSVSLNNTECTNNIIPLAHVIELPEVDSIDQSNNLVEAQPISNS